MPFKVDMTKASPEGWHYTKGDDPMPTQNPFDPVSRDVSGNPIGERPTATARFERFMRELMAEGYTEAEIENALDALARSYISRETR